jgi:uncharacterized membrane protein
MSGHTQPPTAPVPGDLLRWGAVLVASVLGLMITTALVVQKVALLEDPTSGLLWDLSDRVSCTAVLGAWQSSVFGPPNGVIGVAVFAILASAALGGMLGGRPSRSYLLAMWGLALVFAAFATWFTFQSAFVIDAWCLWCTGIVTVVLTICAALTRIAANAQAWGDGRLGAAIAAAVAARADLVTWVGWWLVIAGMLTLGLT